MKKALVAGALGVTGRTLVNHLVSLGDWEVIGLSRRSPEFQTSAKYIAVDLTNRSAVESELGAIGDITHIFYAALYWGANVFDEVGPNVAMLRNLVEVVERSSKQFRKVVLLEGAKWYGAHLGPYKTPAREDDPRHMPPNFYYEQEDYLKTLIEYDIMSDTNKSRKCGFLEWVDTEEMLVRLFTQFQKIRFIPSL